MLERAKVLAGGRGVERSVIRWVTGCNGGAARGVSG